MAHKISIITINYNNRNGLEKTICSVASQSYPNYEYIVIDGGSTDQSIDVIKQYESKISYWVSESDRGIYHAMNKGIEQAKGDYCLFLNSGDGLLHDHVLSEFCSVQFNEDIVYGNVIKLYPKKNEQNKGIAKSQFGLYDLIVGRINHQAAFIKRNLFDCFGLYSEEYKIASDWKFFIDAIIVGNASVKYVDKDVAFFDVEGMSSTQSEETHKETMHILQNTFPARVLSDIKELDRYKRARIVRWYDQLIQNKFLLNIYNIICYGKSAKNP